MSKGRVRKLGGIIVWCAGCKENKQYGIIRHGDRHIECVDCGRSLEKSQAVVDERTALIAAMATAASGDTPKPPEEAQR